jgi:hypothetical protein
MRTQTTTSGRFILVARYPNPASRILSLSSARDEAVEYAKKLYDAGISTEPHVFPGVFAELYPANEVYQVE